MTRSSGKHPDDSREQAMRDEMQFHVEMEADELQRMGVPADEAKRRALASFGGMRRYAEEANDARRGNWREDLRRDVRYSLRSLARLATRSSSSSRSLSPSPRTRRSSASRTACCSSNCRIAIHRA